MIRSAAAMMALMVCGVTTAAMINVPSDYTTIQAAVDAASNGDMVIVAPGTYTGTTHHGYVVRTLGKAITIKASGTPGETILDGEGMLRVVICNYGEGADTIIEGFTITGGYTDWDGGGIYCDNSSPMITNCTITGNTATTNGGGILCNESNPTITGCTISGNNAHYGGGIACLDASPMITSCTITGNTAAGSDYTNHGGGGIYCSDSNPTISDCTISDNTTNAGGGGIYCSSSSPTITGCTISGNTAAIGDYKSGGGGIKCNWDCLPLISGGSVCGNSPDQIHLSNADIISAMCWIAASCDDNPYLIIANQQEQIDQLLNMHAQQQSAIDELQLVVVECCAERTCAGDENKDGVVNIYDLLLLLESWGPCP